MYEKDKLRALLRLHETEPEFYALVFCRTRHGADRLADKLSKLGLDVEAMHGDVSQSQRERILAKFKSGHATILVATDVAARGIDINDLTHVINFDLPDSPEAYIHRIGRTGRAGKSGKAISFVANGEWRKMQDIMRHAKTTIRRSTLPSGQAVIELKRNAMASVVYEAAGNDVPQEYHTLAREILASSKPSQLLAALLQLHFGGKLNASAFPEIEEPARAEGSWKRRDAINDSRHHAPKKNGQRSYLSLKKNKSSLKKRYHAFAL
jgi:ATP-dependent RNA helicase DeaD